MHGVSHLARDLHCDISKTSHTIFIRSHMAIRIVPEKAIRHDEVKGDAIQDNVISKRTVTNDVGRPQTTVLED